MPLTDLASHPALTRASLLRTWLPAIALALLGTAILWDALPGINWLLCTLGVTGTVAALAYRTNGRVPFFTLATGAFAVLLAGGATVTSRDELHFFAFVAIWFVLGLMVVYQSFDDLRLWAMFTTPWRAIRTTFTGTAHDIRDASTQISSPRSRPLIRGILMAIPVAIILIALLANADPVFESLYAAIQRIAPDLFSRRTFFGLALFIITLGIFASITRRLSATLPRQTTLGTTFTLGSTEQTILLSVVAAIMWLFVISAIFSLLSNPAAQAGTGITYAEYARRGFAELSVAATLVIGVVLAANHGRTVPLPRVRWLALAALAGVAVILGLAFTRVIRYEMAYGYTTLRVYAQAYMIVLLFWIGALVRDVWHPDRRRIFFPALVITSFLALATVLYWNVEAWIVHRNVDRYQVSGKIDTRYLSSLSYDALPALLQRQNDLDTSTRATLRENLLDSYFLWNLNTQPSSWFEWNWRRERARKLYREYSKGEEHPDIRLQKRHSSKKKSPEAAPATTGPEKTS